MHATKRLISRATAGARDRLLVLAALLLLCGGAGAAPAEEFLLPDQAFLISGQADGPGAVRLRWDIADGYYMYKSKFRFTSKTRGIDTQDPNLPEAQIRNDEFFGEVPIYRNAVDIRVPVEREAGSEDILTLEVSSQGCADAGLCYPPHRQTLLLELPKLAAVDPARETGAAPVGEAMADLVPGRVIAPDPNPAPASAAATATATRATTGGLVDPGGGGAGSGEPDAGPISLGLGDEEEILTADQAFQFEAEVAGPERLQLTWSIAPETYLYANKVELALEGGDGVALGAYQLPAGDIKKDSILPDGSTGDVEVFHDGFDLAVPLVRRLSNPTEVTLVARYQGCAELGICYPPQTKRVKLSLPQAATATLAPAGSAEQPIAPPSASPAPAQAAAEPISEQDRIAEVLKGGNLWLIVAAFFGFGLLLAFTPCVFPMIPILSGIIAGQGPAITTRKAFTLSVVYVLAMALTYTVAGVLAGLFGANLQAAFQNPWILSIFALVFVALAFSMFGFFELQLPSSLQSKITEISNKQEGGTLIGVAIMGFLSALIVGPCVAPPLFGALIYISQTGDAVLGGVALFALSLGMGAPLVAIGTSAGKLLPRAGAWMDAVKAVFGVLLLGVAILLLERILPAAVAMLLWGLLLICSAIYMGALTQLPAGASGWSKLWKGLGVFLLLYGALMVVGAAAGGKDTVQPLRGLAVGGGSGGVEHLAFKRIKSTADLDRELAAARAAGRPTMLDFYADWCVSCKEMERYTFSDPAVIAEMGRFVLLQADVTDNDAEDQALMQDRFGIPGPPAMLFFDAEGKELRPYRLVGFKPAGEFTEHLRRVAP